MRPAFALAWLVFLPTAFPRAFDLVCDGLSYGVPYSAWVYRCGFGVFSACVTLSARKALDPRV